MNTELRKTAPVPSHFRARFLGGLIMALISGFAALIGSFSVVVLLVSFVEGSDPLIQIIRELPSLVRSELFPESLIPLIATSMLFALLTFLFVGLREWWPCLFCGMSCAVLYGVLFAISHDDVHPRGYALVSVMVVATGILTGLAMNRFHHRLDQFYRRREERTP